MFLLAAVLAMMVATVFVIYFIMRFVFKVDAARMMIFVVLASFLILTIVMGSNLLFELSAVQLMGIVFILVVLMAMVISRCVNLRPIEKKEQDRQKEEGPVFNFTENFTETTRSVIKKQKRSEKTEHIAKIERDEEGEQGEPRMMFLSRMLHSKDLKHLLREAYGQMEKRDYDSAVSSLKSAAKVAKEPVAIALIEAEIGRINLILGEEDKAIRNLTKAQNICNEDGDEMLGDEMGAVLKKITSPLRKSSERSENI